MFCMPISVQHSDQPHGTNFIFFTENLVQGIVLPRPVFQLLPHNVPLFPTVLAEPPVLRAGEPPVGGKVLRNTSRSPVLTFD